MTKEEKKAMLREYQALEGRIQRLLEEKARWRAKATAVSPVYSDMPRGGGRSDKVARATEKILEVEAALEEEIDAQVALRRRIERGVRGLEDGRFRDVMRRRYIDGGTWERIAEDMHYSTMQVCRLHTAALERILL